LLSKYFKRKYNYQKNEENLVNITYGYSKDKRPNLKQFMIDLMVSNDGDIPLLIRVGNGNESDKKVFAELIKKYQENFDLETIYVADSAWYSAANLGEMRSKNIRWLTRVPLSIKKAQELVIIPEKELEKKSEKSGYRRRKKKMWSIYLSRKCHG
jgi:transposase